MAKRRHWMNSTIGVSTLICTALYLFMIPCWGLPQILHISHLETTTLAGKDVVLIIFQLNFSPQDLRRQCRGEGSVSTLCTTGLSNHVRVNPFQSAGDFRGQILSAVFFFSKNLCTYGTGTLSFVKVTTTPLKIDCRLGVILIQRCCAASIWFLIVEVTWSYERLITTVGFYITVGSYTKMFILKWPQGLKSLHLIQGSFCECTPPMRDDVALLRCLSLAECIHSMSPADLHSFQHLTIW